MEGDFLLIVKHANERYTGTVGLRVITGFDDNIPLHISDYRSHRFTAPFVVGVGVYVGGTDDRLLDGTEKVK